jgi:hypothetical protein
MKTKTIALTIILFFFFVLQVNAQKKKKELPPSTFSLVLPYDNMLGFAPAAYGSFGIKGNLSFTYYGKLWTNPSFGSPTTGTDNWLETGFGLSKRTPKGKWLFNPSLALTHGKLLSGGTEGVIADGIAPSMSVFFKDGVMELETYAVWYKALRKEGLFSYDYALYRLLPGFIINEKISLGLHYEGFVLTRQTIKEGSEQLYQAVGGYVKLTVGERYVFRLSLGKNFKDTDYPNEFYKLTLNIPLLD